MAMEAVTITATTPLAASTVGVILGLNLLAVTRRHVEISMNVITITADVVTHVLTPLEVSIASVRLVTN